METRRLELLAELSRSGSMRAVAEVLGTTTSTVSQQIAALARETGAALVEPEGRRVRLTPAGRRLAEHAVGILAAVEAARLDVGPDAEPNGTLRVAGFSTAVRGFLLPAVADLAAEHPRVRVLIREHEPAEALRTLAADEADLALTYDYNLAPADFGAGVRSTPLWTAAWGLGVPTATGAAEPGRESASDSASAVSAASAGTAVADGAGGSGGTALEVFARCRPDDWIVNSRNTADEHVVRTVASMAGFTPRVTHRADSLDLVQDMIAAGLGVGLLPADQPTRPGVRLLPLASPRVELRAYAVARHGRSAWPPLVLVTRLLAERAREPAPAPRPPR